MRGMPGRRQPVEPFIYTQTGPSDTPLTHPSTHSSTHSSILKLVHLITPPTRPSAYSSIHSSVLNLVHLIPPPPHLHIHPLIHQSIHLSQKLSHIFSPFVQPSSLIIKRRIYISTNGSVHLNHPTHSSTITNPFISPQTAQTFKTRSHPSCHPCIHRPDHPFKTVT